MTKSGFAAVNTGAQAGVTGTTRAANELYLANSRSAGRVVSVVLDKTHPRYKELGGPKAIGAVEIVDVTAGTADYSTASEKQLLKVAYPLDPNNTTYPLVNEIVYITSLPNKKIQSKTSAVSNFYISVINLWNHPHHNGIPYIAGKTIAANSKNYIDTSLGSVNKLTDSTGTIKFGEYFKERPSIFPLQPFEGDSIYQGRWGSSIRLTSTAPGKNNWSSVGTQGDAITIIRNGQTDDNTKSGWDFTTEDINTDASSVYLTTTQKIPFQVASSNYFSYKENTPTLPDQYTGKQILINSGRLIFNSSEDHLMLSSAKSISLSSIGGLNIDTDQAIFQTQNIYLGSKSATEPLILGDALEAVIKELISIIQDIAVQSAVAANSGGPIPTLNQKAPGWINRLTTIDTAIFKSKYNFTV